MRVVIHHEYGGPELLEVAERPRPSPGPGQVVVEVRAASINAADYRLMRADPFLARLENGLLRPKKWPALGSDFAGEVVEIGAGVERVRVGDAVFGDAFADGRGAFAEYVCVRESAVAQVPEGVSFEQAAAVPLAGITALQAVRDLGEVAAGDEVLVQGAGGGVGGFVVQIAKAAGARVTAVCGERSLELVRSFGADELIDYAREDFAAGDARYDVILAVNGRRSPSEYKRCLKPGGRLVVVGGENRQIFEGLLLAPLVFLGSGKRARTLVVDDERRSEDMITLQRMLASGTLRAVVDRSFPLAQAADAIRYVERGHVRGKVVLAA